MKCEICSSTKTTKNRPCRPPWNLCNRCYKLSKKPNSNRRNRGRKKVDVPKRNEWRRMLQKAWNRDRGCFECKITHIKLNINDKDSPLYLNLDHSNPSKNNGGYMIVAAFVNEMKHKMNLNKFRKIVPLLRDVISNPPKTSSIKELEHSMKRW